MDREDCVFYDHDSDGSQYCYFCKCYVNEADGINCEHCKTKISMKELVRKTKMKVVEASKILKTADEQEKQGFIQTAKVLRELVK